jgi:hypothetical protein
MKLALFTGGVIAATVGFMFVPAEKQASSSSRVVVTELVLGNDGVKYVDPVKEGDPRYYTHCAECKAGVIMAENGKCSYGDCPTNKIPLPQQQGE